MGGVVGDEVQAHRARWLADQNKVEVALRVLEGEAPGLRTSWLTGEATLSPGSLAMVSTVGGIRFLRRKPVTVEIVAADMTTRRGPRGLEVIKINPTCDIVTVKSPTATLELGVAAPVNLEWVLSALAK